MLFFLWSSFQFLLVDGNRNTLCGWIGSDHRTLEKAYQRNIFIVGASLELMGNDKEQRGTIRNMEDLCRTLHPIAGSIAGVA
jgi:hypothetical protein